jgi:hypothetical protein
MEVNGVVIILNALYGVVGKLVPPSSLYFGASVEVELVNPVSAVQPCRSQGIAQVAKLGLNELKPKNQSSN